MQLFRAGKANFADEAFFLNEIRRGDSKAIMFLQDKASGFVKILLDQKKLPGHLKNEVLNDASVIVIKKAREPEFTLQSAKLSTYFIEIVKNVVLNKTRGRQFAGNDSLEDQHHLSDHSVEEYYARKENIELINRLLSDIALPCSAIIRLKYLDGFADEEVVQQQLSPYSTVESLRVKRSDCMKKLKDMAKKML